MGLHDLTEGEGGIQVVAVIEQRLGNAFTNRFQAGEMNDAVKIIFRENTVHSRLVRHIRFVMGNGTADDLFDPADGFRGTVDIVIHDNGIMTRVTKFHAGMGADKAGTAGKQNLHSCLFLFMIRILTGRPDRHRCHEAFSVPRRHIPYLPCR